MPPRSPKDMFDAVCGPLIRATDQTKLLAQFSKPAVCILRDYLGVADPYAAIYEFAGHAFNYVHFTHILFLIVFAVAYCVLAEKFPKITLWQGVVVGILVNIAVHVITLPILGLTPPLLTLPWYEHVSEFTRHALYLVYRAYEARFAKSYHARA